jgi:hypothetical protein
MIIVVVVAAAVVAAAATAFLLCLFDLSLHNMKHLRQFRTASIDNNVICEVHD